MWNLNCSCVKSAVLECEKNAHSSGKEIFGNIIRFCGQISEKNCQKIENFLWLQILKFFGHSIPFPPGSPLRVEEFCRASFSNSTNTKKNREQLNSFSHFKFFDSASLLSGLRRIFFSDFRDKFYVKIRENFISIWFKGECPQYTKSWVGFKVYIFHVWSLQVIRCSKTFVVQCSLF